MNSSEVEVAEYRRRTEEAIDHYSREDDPEARDYWRRAAIENSRLVDLITMRKRLGFSLFANFRNVQTVSAIVDLNVLETAEQQAVKSRRGEIDEIN